MEIHPSLIDNKVAFVTGAASGISKEIVFALAKTGLKVVLITPQRRVSKRNRNVYKIQGGHVISLQVGMADQVAEEFLI